ncbi:uncharacterized protein KY384_000815 [Bacidia gigantensis]|uniref:uncharacterized protein n=1 Tax=Bacidia gigantensis TaxID=2732470 RepID=UPI001D0436D6|nr:uncharacterized protein KY384_000815 [Bacidia gigantensis]KAG8526053.1 hypothetical protein KY384_000815 [Bacidia gigantensis]
MFCLRPISSWTTLFILSFTVSVLADCKNKPGSAGWPSPEQWTSLNSTLQGKLLKALPPGGVCHQDQPNYNEGACKATLGAWLTEDFHAQNPFSFDYNDDTCFPDARANCSLEGYPNYVVDARTSSDIEATVKFAQEYNIRVVVKATGHDYNFRSNAPNSLRIWTHNMKSTVFHQSFTPAGSTGASNSSSGSSAMTLSAGTQWGEAYKAASENNVEVVGGSNPSVGIGGLILGGGHGPLTAQKGLAADQALEFNVVTPDGTPRVCNEFQNTDLFWALRGGGGSTFAVVVDVTVRAYPMEPVTTWGFQTNSTNNSALWDASTYFHTQLVQLNEAGLTCYYYIKPSVGGDIGSLYGIFVSFGAVNATELVQPLQAGMRNGSWSAQNLTTPFGGIPNQYPNLYAYTVGANTAEAVGNDGRLGSRLLTEEALTSDPAKLRIALEQSTPPGNVLFGHLTAGKGVREARPAGGGNAVLPAWRFSYVHAAMSAPWSLLNSTAATAAIQSNLRDTRVAGLRELAPNTGAYMSEGDPTEANWQQVFWGDNYPTLLNLKKKYDPNALFYCVPCVGSELYVEQDGVVCTKDGSRFAAGNGTVSVGNGTMSAGNNETVSAAGDGVGASAANDTALLSGSARASSSQSGVPKSSTRGWEQAQRLFE